jgi:tRNA-specific 2-thiouridylase
VVDIDGATVAEHGGIAGFTVGQRRGLGVAVGEPRYVLRIEPTTSTVVVGRREDLRVDAVSLGEVTWTDGFPRDGAVMAQFRAHGDPVPASLAGSTLLFTQPQTAVAPGQTIAFYDDDRVLGGALITSTA